MHPRTSANPDSGLPRRKGEPSAKTTAGRPPTQALTLLQSFAGRSQRKSGVPLPLGFVRDTSERGPVLPLVLRGDLKLTGTDGSTVRGGRGGAVRLKLLLSMHCVAARTPYDVTRSPLSWAQMLNLVKDDTDRARDNAARQVRDAMDWLEDHKLIRVESKRGSAPKAYLRSSLGDDKDYTRPSPGHGYIQVPISFWRNGWIVALSGTALAMWLVLADLQGSRWDQDVWVPPAEARDRYRLSPDTFSKGINELKGHRLVTVNRVPIGLDEWLDNRVRNAYRLRKDQLEVAPDRWA